MDIKFKIDPDRMTLKDLLVMENASAATWEQRRNLLAKHIVDDKGNYLAFDAACDVLGDLTIPQLSATVTQFVESMQGLQNTQLPLANNET